jgi:hypothetical protein
VLGGCWFLGWSHTWQCTTFARNGQGWGTRSANFHVKLEKTSTVFGISPYTVIHKLFVVGFKCFLIHSGVDEFPCVSKVSGNIIILAKLLFHSAKYLFRLKLWRLWRNSRELLPHFCFMLKPRSLILTIFNKGENIC